MAKLKVRNLSNHTVDRLEAQDDTVYWDRKLPGFGVRVYASGAKVYVVQARGPDGTRRVTLGRHGVLGAEEARRRGTLVIARIKAGQDPLPERTRARRIVGPTVAEVAARYMEEHVAVRCKPSTARIRRSVIGNHIVPRLGRLSLAAVERHHVIALHQRMAATPTQANIVVETLSQIFRKAETWGIVPEETDPCGSVVLYRKRRRERFLTDTEFERLGRVLDEALEIGGASWAAVAAIRLLLLTGCRRSEILSLRWDDVDLAAHELRLRDTKTGPRIVPLSPSAVKLLASLPRSAGKPWVIPGRGTGSHMRKLGYTWRLLRLRADLPDVRLHDLRHSFASRALALGETLPMIGKLLGHRRITSTVRYAHLARASVHEAAEQVADSIAADIL
ncbi:tyrosine-type recombinase/integrase [Candidatus Rariloculus sp.]|uniref:tyrosine-type recombinase/integrase n=1 Tax=Candidatus Rariloculus sp. TaxID=3101265 RepID=UPI003D136DF8